MSDSQPAARTCSWLAERLPEDVVRSLTRLAQADDVCYLAIMPDVHLARDVCVGAVVATTRLIYPAAVGGDIGCGMAAVRFDADASLLSNETAAGRVLSGLYRGVPGNKHSSATMPASLPDVLESQPLSDPRLEKLKRRDGRVQFGTLGRGNHFLEFQADQEDRLWLMVHSGSRAMGQAITAHHTEQAILAPKGLSYLDSETSVGQAYLADVVWAIHYARLNRLAMVKAAAAMLAERFAVEADWTSLIEADHNHVRRELHFGREFWIHRKGAQSASIDEAGIVPGSMGTPSFHVAGRGRAESLCSSSHGAGRKLSRTEARQQITQRHLHRQMGAVWFDHRRADALRDEAPTAYKDILAVMRAQRELTRIVRELRPILSYKG